MGVSFKISKTGRRFCPKAISSSSKATTAPHEQDDDYNYEISKLESAPKLQANVTSMDIKEDEVSFTLILLPDGYSIGKPSENYPSYQAMLQDALKLMHPYDRASEAIFSAIESGRVPGDILDDIPCKYINGTLVCEVQDYRNCASFDSSPITSKICLRMSFENVVKDIPLISNDTWTYHDLMEVESRIVKALQPQLCLDPTPKLDRLCENPVRHKLNLDIRSMRRKRRGDMAEVLVTSSNKIHGKKVCIDRVPESSSSRVGDVGPISGNLIHENAQDTGSNNAMVSIDTSFLSQPSIYQMGTISNVPVASPSGQETIMSYTDNMNQGVSSVHARRDRQDDTSSPGSSANKRARQAPLGPNGNLQGSNLQRKNTLLNQQQFNRGFQQMYEAQQGIRFPKEELIESDKSEFYQNRNDFHMVEAERNQIQQRLPPQHAFMRSNFPQPCSNSFVQPMENNSRKEELYQKNKSVATSLTSSGNDNPMQRQQQLAGKCRTNSLPKTATMSGIGSPASVGNMSVPLNASSPADETLAQFDRKMLDRFSKLELVATRHQINRRKNKVDEKPLRKPAKYPSQDVMTRLSDDSNGDNFIAESDNKELAKSLVGGSTNACKIRVLTFAQNERVNQGNGVALVPKSPLRMILFANPSDGTIAMHYGDNLDGQALIAEENLPTLPNAHFADILAAQLSSLMVREGYEYEDKILPKPIRINHTQQSTSGTNLGIENQQYSDAVPGQQQYNEVARPTDSANSALTQNQNTNSPRMLPPQHLSQGFLPSGSVPKDEPQSSFRQNSNALLGNNQMAYNKPYSLQYQLMQQQQQEQQPRKTMMDMGGNTANNVVGLGGLGNVMGMGGPSGIRGPMGPVMGQNMNQSGTLNITNMISQRIRNGQINPQALMEANMRMAGRVMSGGARQLNPGLGRISLSGDPINRGINPMQRPVMGTMDQPKLMQRMNLYMNPQQQQQMQVPPQQFQQQKQQQVVSSPLQAVISPSQQLSQQSQQEQAASPQQMSQRTPMSPQMSPQLSSHNLGSVSSIANSPMDQLQGANKNNSTNNI